MAKTDIVVALTGASGSPYGLRLLEVLLKAGRVVHLTISPAAAEVLQTECGRTIDLREVHLEHLLGPEHDVPAANLKYHHFRNFQAGIASGSFLTGGMAIVPCSMGTIAAIANGMSENLIHRAADVHLKEKRKLIVVPRETPLTAIALRNLTKLAEVGAVVLPAMPAFYTKPRSIQDMIDFVVGRVCDQLEVEHKLFQRWGKDPRDTN